MAKVDLSHLTPEERAFNRARTYTNNLEKAVLALITEFETALDCEVTGIDVNPPDDPKRVYVLWENTDDA